MTELEFKSLAAQGYNRIPLIAEAFADLETPLTLYLKLAQTAERRQEHLPARIGGRRRALRPLLLHRPAGHHAAAQLRQPHRGRQERQPWSKPHEGNPLDFIAQFQARFKVALRPGMPRFCGGLAGYFGYDTVRHIEKRAGATRRRTTTSACPTSSCW